LQEDNFIPTMTSSETLTFYAGITLTTADKAAHHQRVKDVLAAVGLAAASSTLVCRVYRGSMIHTNKASSC
jgi:ABC-type multidrug transport system ATPase subunit